MAMFLGGFYVRTKRDGQRVFGPSPLGLVPGHPLVGSDCMACGDPFEVGHLVALVALGPDNKEDREKWMAGRYVSAVAIPLHAECGGVTLEIPALLPDAPVERDVVRKVPEGEPK